MEVNLELEAVTPIFMRGADQSRVEIRGASIKGLMRWWFRALAGNYFGNDIEELRKAEEYVFGSTKQRSRVVVEVVDAPEPSKLHFKPGVIDSNSKVDTLRYLWFSVNLLSRKGQFEYYYPEGTKFKLKLKSPDLVALKLAVSSLWAAAVLGGIGFRSRRGAGSLLFIDGDLKILEQYGLKVRFKDKNELKTSIEQAINLVGDSINKSKFQTIIVIPLTKQTKHAHIPGNVLLRKGDANLPKTSLARCTHVMVIDKTRLREKIGTLSTEKTQEIIDHIIWALGRGHVPDA